MARVVIFEFPSDGPFGDDALQAMAGAARELAADEHLVLKLWTEDATAGVSGGVYVFTDVAAADAYVVEHTRRLAGFGFSGVSVRQYDLNTPLSLITHTPPPRA